MEIDLASNRPHQGFAGRLDQACDKAGVPARNHGRLRWIRDGLARRFGEDITVESVRKWLAGEALPRPKKLKKLAELLGVDEGWLYSGLREGLEEKAAAFDHRQPQAEPGDRGQLFLDRIRQRFAGTVTILPGVDLTDPTWEEGDDRRE